MPAATSPASPSSRHLAIEDLDRAIVNLSARINAATSELLALIGEFDERAGFLKWGFASCTDWLHWRCDLSLNAAREKVRVAHALKSLPQMSAAFARGTLTLTVELPFEQGELICRALDKAVEDCAGNGPEYADTSWHAQQADALVALARSYLAGGSESPSSSADRYQVVIHVDQTALTEGTGRSDLPRESVRRLTCDASVIAMTDGPDGEPLNVGRKQRTVPTAIKRALWARDGGCSFPGCTHTRFVDAHHVRAIPVHGYQPEDMIDDANTSAEVYAPHNPRQDCDVREARGRYRVRIAQPRSRVFLAVPLRPVEV